MPRTTRLFGWDGAGVYNLLSAFWFVGVLHALLWEWDKYPALLSFLGISTNHGKSQDQIKTLWMSKKLCHDKDFKSQMETAMIIWVHLWVTTRVWDGLFTAIMSVQLPSVGFPQDSRAEFYSWQGALGLKRDHGCLRLEDRFVSPSGISCSWAGVSWGTKVFNCEEQMCQVPFVPLLTHNAIPSLGSNFQMILHIHIFYLYLNGYFRTYSARMSAGNSGPVARFHRLVPGIKLIPLEKLMKTCPHKVGPIPAPRVRVCVCSKNQSKWPLQSKISKFFKQSDWGNRRSPRNLCKQAASFSCVQPHLPRFRQGHCGWSRLSRPVEDVGPAPGQSIAWHFGTMDDLSRFPRGQSFRFALFQHHQCSSEFGNQAELWGFGRLSPRNSWSPEFWKPGTGTIEI